MLLLTLVLASHGRQLHLLDKASEDGHKIGDELAVGDVLTVILTSKLKAVRISKDKVYMNVPLEEILALFSVHSGHGGKLCVIQNVQAAKGRIKSCLKQHVRRYKAFTLGSAETNLLII